MTRSTDGFSRQPMATLGGFAAVALLAVLAWPASPVFLVAFSAVLLALLLNGLADLVTRMLPLPSTVARLLVMLLLTLLFVGFLFLAGPRLGQQASEFADRLPAAIAQVRKMIPFEAWESRIENLDAGTLASGGREILAGLTGVVSTTLTLAANVVAILIIGIYLALQPGVYVEGVLHLVPARHRQCAQQILQTLGHALRWWLIGRFASMVGVGLLTTLGLWAVDMPLALVLGVIAGLFSFVPYVGPISAVVPALLIAVTVSLTMVLSVLVVYSAVQFVEGNFLTPIIQRRAVSLPPALLLLSQFSLGLFYGLFGVLLATPLLIVAVVLVQLLYVQGLLGEPVRVLGGDHRGAGRTKQHGSET